MGRSQAASRSTASTSGAALAPAARICPGRRSRSSTTRTPSCSASRGRVRRAGHERAVGVTLGTGLGSAFLEDGRDRRHGPGGAARRRDPPRLVSRRSGRGDDLPSALIERYGEAELDVAEIATLAPSRRRRARKRRSTELATDAGRGARAVAATRSRRRASSSAGRSRGPGICSSPRCGARSRTFQRSRRSGGASSSTTQRCSAPPVTWRLGTTFVSNRHTLSVGGRRPRLLRSPPGVASVSRPAPDPCTSCR